MTDKIGMALDAKRQTVANDWLNAGDEHEAIEAGSELSGQSSFDDVAAEVDADAHVDFEIDDDQVEEE